MVTVEGEAAELLGWLLGRQQADGLLADGEVEEARDELAEFGEKMAKLREEDKLSSGGYQDLAAGLRQLAALLPNR